jgi:hypothetical protein
MDVIKGPVLEQARLVRGYEHRRGASIEDGRQVVEPVQEIDIKRPALVCEAVQMRDDVVFLARRQPTFCKVRIVVS